MPHHEPLQADGEGGASLSTRRIQVLISGRVQGVAFRANCQRQANVLGVTGWVRNLWDGSVEALFEGPDEAVEAMLQWCRQGPSAAVVTGIEVTEVEPGPPHRSFHIRM
jgi:acylphosphatase